MGGFSADAGSSALAPAGREARGGAEAADNPFPNLDPRAADDVFLVLGDGEKLLWAGRPHTVLYGAYYVLLAIEPARRLFFSHDQHASLEATAALFAIVAVGFVIGFTANIAYGISNRRAISLMRFGWFDPWVSYVTIGDPMGETASFSAGFFGTVTIRGGMLDPARFGLGAADLQGEESFLSDGVLPLPGRMAGSVSFIGLGDENAAWQAFKAARDNAFTPQSLEQTDPLTRSF